MTKNILTNLDMNGNQLNVDAIKIVQSDGTTIDDALQQNAFIFGG